MEELLKDLRMVLDEIERRIQSNKDALLATTYAPSRARNETRINAFETVQNMIARVVREHEPKPPIEEPMKVGAKVVSGGGRLFERITAGDTHPDRMVWSRPGSSSLFRWSQIDTPKILFEGYET